MVATPLAESIPGRIQERGLAAVRVRDLREFGLGRHRSVDDTPYGGGAGMVMRVELVVAAIEAVKRPESLVILMDPGGEVFGQARAVDLAGRQHLVFVCALRGRRRADPHVRRLGAVDRRLRRHRWRAAGVGGNRRRDAIAAGAIDELSTAEESFSAGLLEPPVHAATIVRGLDVPVIPTSAIMVPCRPGDVRARSSDPGATSDLLPEDWTRPH